MTFAEKLKELRLKAGLSQSELAAASGRGLGAIRDYEQGKREPSLRAAVSLAEALGCSVSKFADSVKQDVAADSEEKPAPKRTTKKRV
jgi:transcriptional regulator with XRE-family HTH domain